MDGLFQALATLDVDKLSSIAGRPDCFLGLLILAALSCLLGLFLRAHWIVNGLFGIVFLASDGAILYLVFGAAPGLTDYDYGPAFETPPAMVALTAKAQTSARICVPLASLDPAAAMPEVDSYCSNGGTPTQNYFVDGVSGSNLCYTVTAEPDTGQACRISARLRSVERHRRDGLLQYFHRALGLDPSIAGENWPPFPG